MQAMAKAQALSGSVAAGQDSFSTLTVWRDKLQSDINECTGPDYRLRMLLEQGKDVEQAVLGCLKDALFDLHEGVVWGLMSPAFEEQQRQLLLNAAANELHTDKQLCLQLAREHGVLEEYAAALKRGPYRATIADYERLGELKFGLLVWRANLRRDTSLAEDPQEMEAQCHEAYLDALRLVRRCGTGSLGFWAAQQAGGAPTEESKKHVYRAAVQRVQNSLRELAQGRGLDLAALDRLFEQVSDPDSVEDEEGPVEAEAEAEADEGGRPESGGGATTGEQRASRGSSEESESSALGF